MNIKEETKIPQVNKIAEGKTQQYRQTAVTLTNNCLANSLPQREVTTQPTLSPSGEYSYNSPSPPAGSTHATYRRGSILGSLGSGTH